MAVTGFKNLIGHDVLVSITGSAGCLATGHVVKVLIRQHGNMTVKQRHIDVLPQAAAMAFVKCSQDGNGSIHSSHYVGNCDPSFLWAATGFIVTLAGDTHEATHALNHKIIAW